MMQTPQSVLAGIPGWEDASVSELDGGLTNRAWLVATGGRKAVLKIDAAPRTAPFNSRPAEARIQTGAADAGIANQVLHVSDTVYLAEYVEGSVWTRADLESDDNLALLAEALKRMHSLPLTGRTFDATAVARLYERDIEKSDQSQLQEYLRIVEHMPEPHRLRRCHNDLVVENIIATPDIRFLDWEYACDNDPLFDLATITAHHDLSADCRDVLLDAYFDGNGEQWSERLVMFERFYGAILWLWKASRR